MTPIKPRAHSETDFKVTVVYLAGGNFPGIVPGGSECTNKLNFSYVFA